MSHRRVVKHTMLHLHKLIICSKINNKDYFYELTWSDIQDMLLIGKAKCRIGYTYTFCVEKG